MLKPVIYVTSGVAILIIVTVIYLVLRTLYRMVFDISIPQRVVIVDDRKRD